VYQFSPTKGLSFIYAFNGPPDGFDPQGNLTLDSAGNLYGTTVYGGANKTACNGHGCGTVFKLAPPTSKGGSWTETILYSFTGGDDGANPQAGVILDSVGNLYGTTENGGSLARGTVFELSPGQDGVWAEVVLYTYGMDEGGGIPLGGVVFDGSGNLYCTASTGGPEGGGTVFELSPGLGGSWTYALLYGFDASNGSNDGIGPGDGVVFDAAGDLYGTTMQGGNFGFGTVFELTPSAGSWSETILYSFAGGNDGASPMASLVLDAAGNLDGTTFAGGGKGNPGTVFRLTPGAGGRWTEGVFALPSNGSLGYQPSAPLLLDGAGHAYGTTVAGGVAGRGVIFRIAP
jgi:uncharacterized repeat protein (TIGR03803 family)